MAAGQRVETMRRAVAVRPFLALVAEHQPRIAQRRGDQLLQSQRGGRMPARKLGHEGHARLLHAMLDLARAPAVPCPAPPRSRWLCPLRTPTGSAADRTTRHSTPSTASMSSAQRQCSKPVHRTRAKFAGHLLRCASPPPHTRCARRTGHPTPTAPHDAAAPRLAQTHYTDAQSHPNSRFTDPAAQRSPRRSLRQTTRA